MDWHAHPSFFTLIFFKMNKLIFSSLFCLIFLACQDTPKSAGENSPVNTAITTMPEVVTPEAVQDASSKLSTGVKMMEELRKQVDALPANLKKEKSAEIDGMQASLEGMIEKQTGMLNEIKASTTPVTGSTSQESDFASGPSPVQMKEYTESAARYAQEAQAIQEALQKMTGQNKKD